MSKLNIYKASAGSGKTFTLTKEYIKLLFEDPNNFRQILAVTFTNKATDEMKSRILKEVFKLANGIESGYYNDLIELTNNNEELLKSRASDLLYTILHNYSWFSVTTIDSFFQKIVRAFARETGLQMGFNIELDHDRVLNNVTEKLFNSVDKNWELKQWLISFAEKNMQEGKTWNLKNNIGRLSKEIFKEDYKQFDNVLIEKLKDKAFLKQYKDVLQSFATKYTSFMKEKGQEALNIISNKGLNITDFSYGNSGFAKYFDKIAQATSVKDYKPGSRVLSALNNPDSWIKKTASAEVKVSVDSIYPKLNTILSDVVDFYNLNSYMYNSISLILDYIHTLGILTDISKHIREFTAEENVFLISDAAHLLNTIIGQNHSPFIYEKTGVTYKHFMIDEFQDTSGMQWINFQPLVQNSLSEENYSLIVGDVKQSIYRWRNGDWNLLESKLEEEFNDLGTNVRSLNYNWRSKRNIIRFNNSIFYYSANILQQIYNNEIPELVSDNLLKEKDQITRAYSTSYQEIPTKENEGGYVKIEFIESEKDISWEEKVIERLPYEIKELQERGYKAGDIAILVRKADEGRRVADRLMEFKNYDTESGYNFDFISNDSLFLKHSSSVKLIINVIKYLQNPAERVYKAGIIAENNYYSANGQCISEIFTAIDNVFEKMIPEEFLKEIEQLRRMPLYELTEKIISIFKLNSRKEYYPYLQAFQDMISDYCNQNGSDVRLFMDWWEEQKDKKVISVSEEQDAIKILTIHKSKGLEFKVVIIPFSSWEIDSVNPKRILWCKPEEEGINQIELLPVTYSSNLSDTIFYREYFKERLKAYIDNLNLLYVAFTRAEEELICYCPKSSTDKVSKISDLLYFTFTNYNNYPMYNKSLEYSKFEDSWDNDKNIYEFGEKNIIIKKDTHFDNSVDLKQYTSIPLNNRLSLKYHNEEYFEFNDNEEFDDFSPISKGNLMHEVFKNIISIKDIRYSVEKLEFEGKISSYQSKKLVKDIYKLIEDDKKRDWFSDEWQTVNERDIILKDGKVYRPDRVILKEGKAIVIDYKTGKEQKEAYNRQIKTYVKALNEIGYRDIEGYIWYLKDNKIEKVV